MGHYGEMNNLEAIAPCENKASPGTLTRTHSKADAIRHTTNHRVTTSRDVLVGRLFSKKNMRDFPGSPLVKDPPAIAGDKWVRSLVPEDPTCYGATKPVLYNKRSHSSEKLVHLNEE